jgi:hypothetical protein
VDLTATRTALHGIAELLLAGPQYAESGTIRLRIVPGGIATVAAPDLRLEGGELVAANGRHPLVGTYADVASAAGITARSLKDVYKDTAGVGPDDPVGLDTAQLAVLTDALAVGDAALRAFAPGEEPVLWPEHLDVAIGTGEVNYGVSPGDVSVPEPYAYVGPWAPRTGEFWNLPFGAGRPLSVLGGADAVADFFREGARLAAG